MWLPDLQLKELLTALAVALVKFQEGKPFFVNCYPRVVKAEGSREAQQLTDEMTEAVTASGEDWE